MHGGPRNTNRVAILEEGLKFNPIAINNDNAQYVETRNLQALEICRMFRMPPHKIGIIEKTSTGVQEQQALEYVTDCLRPQFVDIEQELNVKMFPSGGFEYEHEEESLLRGDFASQQEGFGKGRSGGWLSVNDVRRKMKLNKIGAEGDIYLSPQNMVPAEKASAVADTLIKSGKTPLGKEPTPTDGKPQGAPDGRSLTEEQIKQFTADLMTDAVGRSMHYDQNAQLPKMISRAFSGVFGAMARMLGREDADVIAKLCAESVHERRSEWDGMTKDQIVAKEYELAFAAMKETKQCRVSVSLEL